MGLFTVKTSQFILLLCMGFWLMGQTTVYSPTVNFKGNLTGGGASISAYPEDYSQSDGTSGINTALAALAGTGVCSPQVTCTLKLQAKVYAASVPVVFNGSYITLEGQGGFGGTLGSAITAATRVNTSSSTTDIVDLLGNALNTNGTCANSTLANTQGTGQQILNVAFSRTTPATSTGDGIYAKYTCGLRLINTTVWDSISNYHIAGTAHTLIQDGWALWSAYSSTTRQGVFIDSSPGGFPANNSFRLKHVIVVGINNGGGVSNASGVLIAGPSIADSFLDDVETATVDYGVNIVSTTNPVGTINVANGDVHLYANVHDGCGQACLSVTNVYGGGVPFVEVNGGYFSAKNAAIVCSNCQGLDVHGAEIRAIGSSYISVQVTGANSGVGIINGNVFHLTGTCVSINGSNNWVISNNQCGSTVSANPVGTGYVFTNSSNNTIHGNPVTGNFTLAASFDSNSNNNQADGNGWPIAAISNAGSNNFGRFPGTTTPSGSCPMASQYINTNGTSGSGNTLYECIGGLWVNVK
jgi:hypothetical protein